MRGVATRPEVERFAEHVEKALGLSLEASRWPEWEALLTERARAAGGEVAAYLERLGSPDFVLQELDAWAAQLTVGETYFFRHEEQLQVLVEEVLPPILSRGGPARVLCAGCSTGEEAWSLALLARQSARVDAERVFITGIDIHRRAVERARQASYSAWSLRATPPPVRERWFQPLDAGRFVLRQEARAHVHFEVRNLLDEAPDFWASGAFDVILCRNVLFYFSPEGMRRVVARLGGALVPGGHLFLGPSETLRGISDAFELQQAAGAFFYRRAEARPAPAPAPRPAQAPRPTPAPVRPPAPGPSKAPAPAARTDAPLEEVLQLYGEERYAEARRRWDALPAWEQRTSGATLVLAALHLHGGGAGEAERLARGLLEQGLAGAAAHFLLGLCHEQSGEASLAASHYARAAHHEPTFALAHFRLGVLARRAGQLPQARAALRLALTLMAREPPLYVLLFGGGFSRNGLRQVCQQELGACREAS